MSFKFVGSKNNLLSTAKCQKQSVCNCPSLSNNKDCTRQ